MSKRKFFSGNSVRQAVLSAASHFDLAPDDVAYREVDKKHGFLKMRKRVIIEVDADDPQRPPVEIPAIDPEPGDRSVSKSKKGGGRKGGGKRGGKGPNQKSGNRKRSDHNYEEQPPPDYDDGGGRRPAPKKEEHGDDDRGNRIDSGKRSGGGRSGGQKGGRSGSKDGGPAASRGRGKGGGRDSQKGQSRSGRSGGGNQGGSDRGRSAKKDDSRGKGREGQSRSKGGDSNRGSKGDNQRGRGGQQRRSDSKRGGRDSGKPERQQDRRGGGGSRGGRDRGGRGKEEIVELPDRSRSASERLQEAKGKLADGCREALERVLDVAGIDVDHKVFEGDDRFEVELAGPDEELLVAEGGDLLRAIEHLVPRAMRGVVGDSRLVRVNCGDFHEIHEERLRSQAQSVAAEVRRTNKPSRMEPMSPADRRIVHVTLADEPGITTNSDGNGHYKQVVVKPA